MSKAIKIGDTKTLRQILNEHPLMLYSIVDQKNYGSALHLAAKYDTRNNNDILSVLIDEYNADTSLGNNGDSLPIYWAFTEMNKSSEPNIKPAQVIINSKSFQLYKRYILRGRCIDFIKEVYYPSNHGKIIQQLIEEKIWSTLKIPVFSRFKYKRTLI